MFQVQPSGESALRPESFKNKGFTLIEILIVMIIMAILSVVIFANYRLGQQQFVLQRATYKLAQDIRRVQAMAGLAEDACKKFGDDFHTDYEYGYGIFLEMTPAPETQKYELIADCNGDGKQSSGDEVIETIDFEEGTRVKELKIDGLNKNKISIVFSPPDPSVFIKNGGDGDLAEIVIRLEDDETKIKTIVVNKAGLIDID